VPLEKHCSRGRKTWEEDVAKSQRQQAAAVGVAEHGNCAVLVTVASSGELLDRRRVDLTSGLPTHPYHHEGSWAVGRYLNSAWSWTTTEERITDTRAANVADSVMYREALATAAQARGWSVHWYQPERVLRDAAAALGRREVDALLRAMGQSAGPPWQAKHKLAAAAALALGGLPPLR
jgi:hypothetical protein